MGGHPSRSGHGPSRLSGPAEGSRSLKTLPGQRQRNGKRNNGIQRGYGGSDGPDHTRRHPAQGEPGAGAQAGEDALPDADRAAPALHPVQLRASHRRHAVPIRRQPHRGRNPAAHRSGARGLGPVHGSGARRAGVQGASRRPAHCRRGKDTHTARLAPQLRGVGHVEPVPQDRPAGGPHGRRGTLQGTIHRHRR